MAHKTFISYKYSEATNLRDRIIEAMGEDATYYQGETSDSPDMSDESNRRIQEYLKDCMFPTSVTLDRLGDLILLEKDFARWAYFTSQWSSRGYYEGKWRI